MARIIETKNSDRRIVRLSTADVMSVVREYQNFVRRNSDCYETINTLSDVVIYIPEDI